MSRGEKRRLRLFKSTDVRWVRLDDPVVPHDRKAELAVLFAMIDQLILALVPRKAEGDGIVQPRRRIRDGLVKNAESVDGARDGAKNTRYRLLTCIDDLL